MRGAATRGIGALVAAAATAASCGWPEFAFEPASEPVPQAGEGGEGAGTGGANGTGGATGGRAGSATGGGSGSAGTSKCDNQALDPPETDVDCGGPACPPCGPGHRCGIAADCEERTCTANGVCELLSCGNDKTDGSETDKDCGGEDCVARCKAGDECRSGTDCESGLCENAHCVSGTCDPEAGTCGTSECHCANGRQCQTHENCASGNCASGTCAQGPKLFSRNDGTDTLAPQSTLILQTFLVQNDAPSALPLGELSLRYYFSSDAVMDQRSHCDQARASSQDACTGVTTLLFSVSSSYADTYVEVRLADGANLDAGAQTDEIPVTIESKDGASYDQRNDYSFAANQSLTLNQKVTLHRQGVLVWGTPPPN